MGSGVSLTAASQRMFAIVTGGQQDGPHSKGDSRRGVQEDARSFGSKLGAIRLLTKNDSSREAFMGFLQQRGKAELLSCYLGLEDIRHIQSEDQAYTRMCAFVCRYKVEFDAAKDAMVALRMTSGQHCAIIVWECLDKLQRLEQQPSSPGIIAPVFTSHDELLRAIKTVQNELLSRLVMSFEAFINSKSYSSWQGSMVDTLKRRMVTTSSHRLDRSYSRSHSLGLSTDSGESCQQLSLATLQSLVPDPSSVLVDSKVLFVDYSKLSMKLAGLSLANGGVTSVDYAANGQVALSMMKQRSYDVVVIDMHMPVMDGFEVVRLYREYESLMLCDGISNRSFSAISEDSDDMVMMNYSSRSCAPPSLPFVASNTTTTTTTTTSSFPMIVDRRSGWGGSTRHLMIIGMSQDSYDDDIKRRALLSGADSFLPKPFSVQKLVAAVMQCRAAAAEGQLAPRGLETYRDDLRGVGDSYDSSSSSIMVLAAERTVP